MPTLIFPNIKPLRSSTIQTIYKKKEAQFGSGYRQVYPAGLNNKEFIINAQFIVDSHQRNVLLNFFDDAQEKPFLFALPGYELGYFTIEGSIKESQVGCLFRLEVEMKTFNMPMQLTTVLAGDTQTVLTVQP